MEKDPSESEKPEDDLFIRIRGKYSPKLKNRHDQLVKEIENDENWDLRKDTSKIKLYRMNWSTNGIYLFKTVFYFENVTVKEMFRHFYCKGGDFQGGEYIRVREPYLTSFRYLHMYDELECITQQTCSYGIIFSNREFIVFQTQRFQEGLITLVGESLDEEDCKKIVDTIYGEDNKKNFYWGELFFGHILRQKEKDLVESIVFTYTYTGIPSLLYNPGAQKSAYDTAKKFIQQFEKDFVKHDKK